MPLWGPRRGGGSILAGISPSSYNVNTVNAEFAAKSLNTFCNKEKRRIFFKVICILWLLYMDVYRKINIKYYTLMISYMKENHLD